MIFRRTFAIVLSVMMIAGGAIAAKAGSLEQEYRDVFAEANALSTKITTTQARGVYLEHAIALNAREQEKLTAVLDARPGFVAEVTALGDALQKATGKVDTEAPRAAALAAQQAVIAEQDDPATVTNATATIHALTAKVNGEVATWDAAQVQLAGVSGPPWSSGGQDGYARVRAALDRVGGGGVGLYESATCAGGSAPACANSNGYIKYRADVASWSEGRLNWAMAHELGHIYQFRVWGSLNASSAYQSLFGGDPEFLANCMASVRGYQGSVGCNGDQQAWASGIWVGAVR